MVLRIAVIAAALLSGGCAAFRTLPLETRVEEATWQSLNAIDTAQTLSIARDPDCYYESLSDPIIGRHPSEGLVLAWMVTAATVHFLITDWLVEHDYPTLARTWEIVSIGSSAYTVSHNFSIGLRPIGHNEPHGMCGEPK